MFQFSSILLQNCANCIIKDLIKFWLIWGFGFKSICDSLKWSIKCGKAGPAYHRLIAIKQYVPISLNWRSLLSNYLDKFLNYNLWPALKHPNSINSFEEINSEFYEWQSHYLQYTSFSLWR